MPRESLPRPSPSLQPIFWLSGDGENVESNENEEGGRARVSLSSQQGSGGKKERQDRPYASTTHN